MSSDDQSGLTRRLFISAAGAGAAMWGAMRTVGAAEPSPKTIQGFEEAKTDPNAAAEWKPFSDRKLRVGIAGFGVCQFGAAFGFQDHPNVEVVAVSDVIPDRCAALARACRCQKTYESCEQMLGDERIEAVFIATDAPSHGRLAIEALKRGKHVASAVPAVWGTLEEAEALFEAVKRNAGLKYMMFETTSYHEEVHAWREQYAAGRLGKLIYTEGEYWHYFGEPLASYKNWRVGLPPQWYPTHSNAFYIGVTGGAFTEVSCMGMPSVVEHLKPANNAYGNPFGTEIALFRTTEGGVARMGVSWDTPAPGGEMGRLRGQRNDPAPGAIRRPALPPGVRAGGHGGSHGHLMNEFVDAVLRDRRPLVDITQALAMTVSGIVAHQSALKGGELMKIPQYTL